MRNLSDPRYVDGDFATGVSAAGTTQSDATTLPANHCEVSTVTAGSGVIVKAYARGEVFSVSNADANDPLLVYPPSGASFNGATADLPATVPARGACFGRFITSTKIILVVY